MYIHQSVCISPQHTYPAFNQDSLIGPEAMVLKAIEPAYSAIPLNILRRMGKAVRMGSGAALGLIENSAAPNGIIIGTANGGMEDCIKFLNQIVEYDEGRLTPTNFVQSTPNAIAAQIALLGNNKQYNITHVHRGLAFENALIDAQMQIAEHPHNTYLVGGIDEISTYNYNIELLAGAYKSAFNPTESLYSQISPGSIAGEGVAMFMVNKNAIGAKAKLSAIKTIHTDNPEKVEDAFNTFLQQHSLQIGLGDVLLSGENADSRLTAYYSKIEQSFITHNNILRYKHFTGEFPTASALSLWLGVEFLQSHTIPNHFIKSNVSDSKPERIFIYNTYKGLQHSFMLLEKV